MLHELSGHGNRQTWMQTNAPEPFVCSPDQARKVPLDILNVVEFGGERVVDIDNKDFPVGLSLI